MTLILATCVAVTVAVSIYLLLSRELKGIAMGVFLAGHAANLSILAMSRSPVITGDDGETTLKLPPLLGYGEDPAEPLATMVDPLPQALILTAIVISFGVMGFLLALIVVTGRVTHTLDLEDFDDNPTGMNADDTPGSQDASREGSTT
ncbi:sodium:proton antiporter [Mucisphaera sp.]|uniref:sodium:proton antiporter n=1 Tax=Mucisphaera sp. TaxID=2913024 RepID=UPI003D0AD678